MAKEGSCVHATEKQSKCSHYFQFRHKKQIVAISSLQDKGKIWHNKNKGLTLVNRYMYMEEKMEKKNKRATDTWHIRKFYLMDSFRIKW